MRRTFEIPLTFFVLFSFAMLGDIDAFEVSRTGSGAEIKWDSTEVEYYFNLSGGPSGSLAALQSSMEAWTGVETADFTFVYKGTTSNSSCGAMDYENIVAFGTLGEGTLAQNSYWYYTGSGKIVDSDIEVNTTYSWATDGSPSTYDLQNVCTHEFGHSLSLADLYDAADSEKTMYGYAGVNETKKRTLHQDDINGIAYLYPGSAGSPGASMPWFLPLLLDDES